MSGEKEVRVNRSIERSCQVDSVLSADGRRPERRSMTLPPREISVKAPSAMASARPSRGGKRVAHTFPNIEVVAGTKTDPRTTGPIDAVVLNSYHELTQYRAMLASMLRALRPGRVLVWPYRQWLLVARPPAQ